MLIEHAHIHTNIDNINTRSRENEKHKNRFNGELIVLYGLISFDMCVDLITRLCIWMDVSVYVCVYERRVKITVENEIDVMYVVCLQFMLLESSLAFFLLVLSLFPFLVYPPVLSIRL